MWLSGMGKHSSQKFQFGQLAFLPSEDEPKLVREPFHYQEMSLFSGNVHLQHLGEW